MNTPDPAWEQRLEQAWHTIDDLPAEAFVEQIERLAAELPPHSAISLFERACAQDSTGHPDKAVPLYRSALQTDLTGLRRRRFELHAKHRPVRAELVEALAGHTALRQAQGERWGRTPYRANRLAVANHEPMPVAMMKAPSRQTHRQDVLGLQLARQLRLARHAFEKLHRRQADAQQR